MGLIPYKSVGFLKQSLEWRHGLLQVRCRISESVNKSHKASEVGEIHWRQEFADRLDQFRILSHAFLGDYIASERNFRSNLIFLFGKGDVPLSALLENLSYRDLEFFVIFFMD